MLLKHNFLLFSIFLKSKTKWGSGFGHFPIYIYMHVGHRSLNHVGILYMPKIVIKLQKNSVLLSNDFGEAKEIES